ncbi:vacuolar protein sorting-associated protein 33A [Culex quinquefasciatus]|uniref:Vacuolar protein sorting-associated protein 33A n=4 Tax=Culex pipiens complex TaxID=518105 RepID=B0X2Y2_CULQU|nr:vacuolar protein sorting-associated protein 33A [Culex quinquefasciatus]XP_039450830.1 vacuolar protein sorting-associated protein 33A [Culex pipiens pallens]EDS39484.1 vacuolar protein sorting-associated protein 33A [Culex quinquefasciatus]|eukprot:XP_001864004.1 vacuolar protein sorting-associated protein 33A [Culex quinquefasciatus]
MFTHLSGGRANIQLIQEAAVRELVEILDRCEGTKAIIWDESLGGPVGLVARYTFLKEHHVTKMYPLRPEPWTDIDVKNIIFITRPNQTLMDYIANNIHEEERKKKISRKEYYLYFLPKKSFLCEKRLQVKGVHGSLAHIGEFRCDFFPFDNDLLSMELKDAYRDLYLEGDTSSLHQSACALIALQKLFGRIPKVYGKGSCAQRVWELTKTMADEDETVLNSDKGVVDQMIILDRSIDLMSVLATQLTYEGLIDEIFGINNTTVNLPSETFNTGEGFTVERNTEKSQFILNSKEQLYAELRDKNFNAVGAVLSRLAKSIRSRANENHGEKSIQELKKFVESLPHIKANEQSLATHTKIAELIKEVISSDSFLDELGCEQEFMMCADVDKPNPFIEDLIAKQAPLRNVLRLMCMQSIAGSGLKPKVLEYYKRELVQVYGLSTLLTIGNLEKAGLLKPQTGTRTYAVLRKTLNLTAENPEEVSPKDITYVHSIYAPLSIRIVEQHLKPNGWQSLNDVLSCLPGPTFEDFQPAMALNSRRGSFTSEISQSDIPRVIVVCFVGGCTFAEISALRFLAQQDENNVEFVVCTTKLINKNSFLDTFIEKY